MKKLKKIKNSNPLSQDQSALQEAHQRSWIFEVSDGVVIRLKIQAQASKTEIVGLYGEDQERLKIRIAAKPVDHAANEELLRFLKKILQVSSSQLHLIRGQLNPLKDVFCHGVSVTALKQTLLKEE